MLRLRFCRSFILLAFISLAILVLADDSGPNWKEIELADVNIMETGKQIGDGTYFEVNEVDGKIKATGCVNLTDNIPPETTVKWAARYLNPDDNQFKTQAESKPTGLCDFMAFQAPVAQMFFEDSNMTVCPFQKGFYVFPGSGPKKEAFPQRIPTGRDEWEVEVIADKMGEIVAHLVIKATLKR